MSAGGDVRTDHRELLTRAYAAYNAQDVEALLACVSDDVDWPDGARRLHGKAQVRSYWTEQWTRTRTHDEPVSVSELGDGRIAVLVGQVVRSLEGAVLSTGRFRHVHRIDDHLIARMDIQAAQLSRPLEG